MHNFETLQLMFPEEFRNTYFVKITLNRPKDNNFWHEVFKLSHTWKEVHCCAALLYKVKLLNFQKTIDSMLTLYISIFHSEHSHNHIMHSCAMTVSPDKANQPTDLKTSGGGKLSLS